MSSSKRRASVKHLVNCEKAINTRCRCRCGGLLHGVDRMGEYYLDKPALYFDQLPIDDPHYREMSKRDWKQFSRESQRRMQEDINAGLMPF